ncbi:hypothetical protein MMH89_02405 [Candidatus Comchoanobacter bicostacola]|uniref:Uncharacterized protein n=1 Tax=Candidatus Comchoanobacter bicostacola TaxID=2919598 RepID=A0ABY5DH34_9GAMM|nr:hypothetical protein [Candidatus Comchoanobacter bicostacola]UTC24078.1 hypothetical protein MMH89_02405 [Candidatus Comchoanobacter bicostacola]
MKGRKDILTEGISEIEQLADIVRLRLTLLFENKSIRLFNSLKTDEIEPPPRLPIEIREHIAHIYYYRYAVGPQLSARAHRNQFYSY